MVENTVGKGETLFRAVFSKDFYYRHIKLRVCFEKGIIGALYLRKLFEFKFSCVGAQTFNSHSSFECKK